VIAYNISIPSTITSLNKKRTPNLPAQINDQIPLTTTTTPTGPNPPNTATSVHKRRPPSRRWICRSFARRSGSVVEEVVRIDRGGRRWNRMRYVRAVRIKKLVKNRAWGQEERLTGNEATT